MWFLRYVGGRTDRQTNSQADMLITILRSPIPGQSGHVKIQVGSKRLVMCYLFDSCLARSAKLPTGLYILPSVISFFFLLFLHL